MDKNLNQLMEQAMALDRKIAQKFSDDYPALKVLFGELPEKRFAAGIRVLTDDGPRDYTWYYEGLYVKQYKEGLQHDISVPLMPDFECKPIVEISGAALHNMLAEEEYIISEPLKAMQKYLPEFVLRFR